MKHKLIKLLPALLTIIVAGVVFCCLQERKPETEIREPVRVTDPETKPVELPVQEIWVYICGEVLHPGVYCVEQGARIYEVVEMAGGLTEDAAEGLINLAAQAEDGQLICVPGREEVLSEMKEGLKEQDGRININTASEQELITLPGIGEAKAKAIIAYREVTPFRTIDEIMNVSGIKENSFQLIRDLIKV